MNSCQDLGPYVYTPNRNAELKVVRPLRSITSCWVGQFCWEPVGLVHKSVFMVAPHLSISLNFHHQNHRYLVRVLQRSESLWNVSWCSRYGDVKTPWVHMDLQTEGRIVTRSISVLGTHKLSQISRLEFLRAKWHPEWAAITSWFTLGEKYIIASVHQIQIHVDMERNELGHWWRIRRLWLFWSITITFTITMAKYYDETYRLV